MIGSPILLVQDGEDELQAFVALQVFVLDLGRHQCLRVGAQRQVDQRGHLVVRHLVGERRDADVLAPLLVDARLPVAAEWGDVDMPRVLRERAAAERATATAAAGLLGGLVGCDMAIRRRHRRRLRHDGAFPLAVRQIVLL